MNFRRTAAILLRQFYLMRGSPARILPLFTWAAINIVVWGFITKYLNIVASSKLNFVAALLGAVLLWDFFTRVMQGVTMTFFEDVWSRNFLNMFATPLSISEYLTGLVLSSIGTSAVGLTVMVALGAIVFHLSPLIYGLAVIPFLLVLFLFGIAMGIFGTAIVLRLGPAAEWFIWPIPALISPFAGVFYPLSILPRWMQYVGYVLPPGYVYENLRAIVSGHAPAGSELFLSALLALFYIVLACWFFVRIYRRAVRTGLIARYTAETLS